MSRYEFSLAEAADDAALRTRMAADWMPGALSVSFRREPNYFDGCRVQGEQSQVVKCVDRVRRTLVGMGSRLVSHAYVNGVPQRFGYLADLRSDPVYRRHTLLARGYGFFRELHRADPIPLYCSLIWHDNQQALANLTGARAGLPHYRDAGLILTPAIHLDVPHAAISTPGLQCRRATPAHMPAVWRLIGECHAQKQFAPVYRPGDLENGRLRGLTPEDFYVALRDGVVVGAVAAWDQGAFRQTHIERYSPALALARPLYNLAARCSPLKPLPPRGARVPYFYLALVAIAANDVAVFRALLRFLYRDRRRGPWHYFIPGLHERDPLAQVLKEYRRIPAAGRLFVIHYPEDAAAYAALDRRIPYIEIGSV